MAVNQFQPLGGVASLNPALAQYSQPPPRVGGDGIGIQPQQPQIGPSFATNRVGGDTSLLGQPQSRDRFPDRNISPGEYNEIRNPYNTGSVSDFVSNLKKDINKAINFQAPPTSITLDPAPAPPTGTPTVTQPTHEFNLAPYDLNTSLGTFTDSTGAQGFLGQDYQLYDSSGQVYGWVDQNTGDIYDINQQNVGNINFDSGQFNVGPSDLSGTYSLGYSPTPPPQQPPQQQQPAQRRLDPNNMLGKFDDGVTTGYLGKDFKMYDENGTPYGNVDRNTGDLIDINGQVVGNLDFNTGKFQNTAAGRGGTLSGMGGSTLDPLNPATSPDIFQPGLFPWSGSYNQSQSGGMSQGGSIGGSTGTSGSINTAGSQSFSGLDPAIRDAVVNSILPAFQSGMSNLEANQNQSLEAARDLYSNIARGAIEDSSQGILGSLANRGMLQSSVAEGAIGRAMGDIAKGEAQKGYETALLQANQKGQQPYQLGGLLGSLGKFSEAGSQSAGTSASQQQSINQSFQNAMNLAQQMGASRSEDKLAPYNLLANFLLGY